MFTFLRGWSGLGVVCGLGPRAIHTWSTRRRFNTIRRKIEQMGKAQQTGQENLALRRSAPHPRPVTFGYSGPTPGDVEQKPEKPVSPVNQAALGPCCHVGASPRGFTP